jgi:predicted carbohydrate-binding protein with CBM48
MTDHESDPVVHRAVEELRRLPALDQAAVQRVAAAAAAARLTPADEDVSVSARPRVRLWMSVGLAAAAAIVGFVARDLIPSRSSAVPTVAEVPLPPVSPAPVVAAAATPNAAVLVPQQFVLENATARRVVVVGDFNNWNPSATPMSRSTDGRLWSAIVPMSPGRHVYGFMVNDSIFTLDPRTATARDPDFGTTASVLMVSRP